MVILSRSRTETSSVTAMTQRQTFFQSLIQVTQRQTFFQSLIEVKKGKQNARYEGYTDSEGIFGEMSRGNELCRHIPRQIFCTVLDINRVNRYARATHEWSIRFEGCLNIDTHLSIICRLCILLPLSKTLLGSQFDLC